MLQVSTLLPAVDQPAASMKLIERAGGADAPEEGKQEISKAYAKKLAKKAAQQEAKKNKAAAGGKQAAGGKPAGTQGGKGGDDASAASTQATNAVVEEEKKVDENAELEGRLGDKQWLGGDQPSKEDADRFAAM